VELVAAVDIGGTKTSAGVVDPDGTLVRSAIAPTPGSAGPDAVLGTVVRLVRGLGADPLALGVGSAGVIDPARGVVVSATDVLAGWAGTDLRGRLAAELGLPVAVDNDVHAHALGETWRGAGRDVRDLLFVAVGTGIGASLVLGGRIHRGAHSVAGHAGHLPVAAAAGLRCTCGATGHLEAIAAGRAMLAAYRTTTTRTPDSAAEIDRRTGSRPNQPHGAARPDPVGEPTLAGDQPEQLSEVDRRARADDRVARSVLAAGATALGSALGGLVNAVDPELVVIGGGVACCGEHWWRPLRSAFAAELLPALREIPVRPAALGADGALIGAARLAWDNAPEPVLGRQLRRPGSVSGPPEVTTGGGRAVLEQLRHRLVVSCQAYPGEPMRDPDTMARVAAAAVAGGAGGIRAQGLDDLRAIRAAVALPLIGLWKDGPGPVLITPTLRHARAVAATGVDIVALDATDRPRPDRSSLARLVDAVHEAGALVMADVSTYDEGLAAAEAGADLVGTTLSGYTEATAHLKAGGPDLDLVERLAHSLAVPVVAEGRIRTPAEAAEALRRGAHTVVVGTAITHPTTLTEQFAAALASEDARTEGRRRGRSGGVRGPR
jgi:glucokinase